MTERTPGNILVSPARLNPECTTRTGHTDFNGVACSGAPVGTRWWCSD
jgi:hypothetical protein